MAAGSLDELIQHGLSALRDTLQQDKTLTLKNTSIAIIGPATSSIPGATTSKKANFRVLEPYLREMRRRRGEPESGEVKEEEEAQADAPATEAAGDAATGGAAPGASDGDGDVQMQE